MHIEVKQKDSVVNVQKKRKRETKSKPHKTKRNHPLSGNLRNKRQGEGQQEGRLMSLATSLFLLFRKQSIGRIKALSSLGFQKPSASQIYFKYLNIMFSSFSVSLQIRICMKPRVIRLEIVLNIKPQAQNIKDVTMKYHVRQYELKEYFYSLLTLRMLKKNIFRFIFLILCFQLMKSRRKQSD